MLESILHLVVLLFFLSFLVQLDHSLGSIVFMNLQCVPFLLECKELVKAGVKNAKNW